MRASAWEQHAELVEAFWLRCLALGRLPHEGEFARADELSDRVGSPKGVLRRIVGERGEAAFQAARARRKGDLSVFFALDLFERRRSSGKLGERTRIDVRELWGSLSKAVDDGRSLLFSLREPATIAAACEAAVAEGIGHLVPGDSLQFDARLTNELPPALRAYVGCAGKLYGEVQAADMVKVHIGSGKVSLMQYDDYEGAAIPMLIERVKIDLRKQQIQLFDYGDEFAPQPLYLKSRYMRSELDGYDAQRAFDDALRALPAWRDEGFGPPLEELDAYLGALPLSEGLVLTSATRPPRSPTPDRA